MIFVPYDLTPTASLLARAYCCLRPLDRHHRQSVGYLMQWARKCGAHGLSVFCIIVSKNDLNRHVNTLPNSVESSSIPGKDGPLHNRKEMQGLIQTITPPVALSPLVWSLRGRQAVGKGGKRWRREGRLASLGRSYMFRCHFQNNQNRIITCNLVELFSFLRNSVFIGYV